MMIYMDGWGSRSQDPVLGVPYQPTVNECKMARWSTNGRTHTPGPPDLLAIMTRDSTHLLEESSMPASSLARGAGGWPDHERYWTLRFHPKWIHLQIGDLLERNPANPIPPWRGGEVQGPRTMVGVWQIGGCG